MKHGQFNAVSVFSGAGGFDLGVEAAGFNTRLCIDLDYHSCRTLRLNRRKGRDSGIHRFLQSAVVYQNDITRVSGPKLLRAARLKPGEVDLVYGGPPCQSFSVFGKRRGLEDPRGQLLLEYIRVIRELRPTAFIFENVAGLLSIGDGSVFEEFLEEIALNEQGQPEYTVSHYLLDTARYGVPQYRSRLIVFGSRSGVKVSKPPETHTPSYDFNVLDSDLCPTPTVGEVLQNMPEPFTDALPNHVGRQHSDRIIERYQSLRYGERDSKTRINKLHPERPSFTIIVGSDKGGGKGHVHPWDPREVTPRESARLQTFPDFWEFSGTSRHPIRQVGNAVPPVFGGVIASHVMREVFGVVNAPTYSEIVSRLQLDYLESVYQLGSTGETEQEAADTVSVIQS